MISSADSSFLASRLRGMGSVVKYEGVPSNRRRVRRSQLESSKMPVLTSPVPTTSQSDIDLIVHGNHWDPFAVLGIHELPAETAASDTWVIRAFLPEAKTAWVVDLTQRRAGRAGRRWSGFIRTVFSSRWFAGTEEPVPLSARVWKTVEGHSWEFVDPYQLRAGPHRFRPALARRRDALPQL